MYGGNTLHLSGVSRAGCEQNKLSTFNPPLCPGFECLPQDSQHPQLSICTFTDISTLR